MTNDTELREVVARAIYEAPTLASGANADALGDFDNHRELAMDLARYRADAALAAIRAAGYEVRGGVMRLPKHVNLLIEHNPHAANYETIEEYESFRDGSGDWATSTSRERAISSGNLWTLQWYPVTPIGFCFLMGATLEEVMQRAFEMDDAG